VLIAERPGEHLRFVKVISHSSPIAEREKHIPRLDADVDGQLASSSSTSGGRRIIATSTWHF